VKPLSETHPTLWEYTEFARKDGEVAVMNMMFIENNVRAVQSCTVDRLEHERIVAELNHETKLMVNEAHSMGKEDAFRRVKEVLDRHWMGGVLSRGEAVRMVEFFSGSGRMAQAFRERGYLAVTVDNTHHPENGFIDHYNYDVLEITREDIICVCSGEPDVLWFGTPCTGFSVASIGTHRGGGFRQYEPKTETAKLGIALAKKCLEIISWFPNAIWAIENPRGVLRKMPFMPNDKRRTITFCQFGDDRMKPTDIWTNLESWVTPPPCKNGGICHVRAPRGAKTGTQGLKGAYDRAVYPYAFCESFAQAAVSAHNSRYQDVQVKEK